MELTQDPELLRSIQELSNSEGLYTFRDTDGERRWIRVPQFVVMCWMYGLIPVPEQLPGEEDTKLSAIKGEK